MGHENMSPRSGKYYGQDGTVRYDEDGTALKGADVVSGDEVQATFEVDGNGDGILRIVDAAPFENVDTILQGVVTVAAAGTRVQLAADTDCKAVEVTALHTNTGAIYVGNSAVSGSAYGKRLAAGDSITLYINNLNKVYIDASTNGEGVCFLGVI